MNVKWSDAQHVLKEGDVLLFKGEGWPAWFIQKAGEGVHTHVALCSKPNGHWEIVEFREGNPLSILMGTRGAGMGRSIALESQLDRYTGRLDVYRPVPEIVVQSYKDGHVHEEVVKFDGRNVTQALRRMTGQPYGWRTIWNFMKYNMFGLRLFYNTTNKVLNDSYEDNNFPVCSTAVAAVFRKWFVDLVPNRADSATEPSDIARSSLLNYLFTIER